MDPIRPETFDNIDFGDDDQNPEFVPQNMGDAVPDSTLNVWDAEELREINEIKDTSPLSRIAAWAHVIGMTTFPFNSSFQEWDLASFVKLTTLVSTLGITSLETSKLGPYNYDDFLRLKGVDHKLIVASLKKPKAPVVQVYDQISLIPELANLQGAVFRTYGDHSDLEVPSHRIKVRVGFSKYLPNLILEGGKEACQLLSAARGVEIQYREVHLSVHFMTSLIYSRKSISFVDGIMTFKAMQRRWRPELTGPAPAVESFFIKVLNPWCEALATLHPKNPPPAGMSPKSNEYLNYLGNKYWQTLSVGDQTIVSRNVDAYQVRVIKSTNIAGLFAAEAVDPVVSPKDWMEIFNTPAGKVVSVTHPGPTADKPAKLQTLASVCDYAENLRGDRAKRDYDRKSDSPSFSGAGKSVVSVPFKFSYALGKMVEHDVKVKGFDIVAFGTAQENHWSEFVDEVASNYNVKVLYRDIVPSFAPGNGAAFQEGDITQLRPDSGKGNFLFDDTYVVAETAKDFAARSAQKTATCPDGKPATYRKLESILKANYAAGIVKVVLGSESSAHIKIGAIPPIYKEFKHRYQYVSFFPGSSAHSQEYLLAFGDMVGDNNNRQMGKRPSPLVDVANNAEEMTMQDWSSYANTWLVARCVDLVRAGILNTVKAHYGIMGGRFVACMKSYSTVRADNLEVSLAGSNSLTGNRLGRVASAETGEGDVEDNLNFAT